MLELTAPVVGVISAQDLHQLTTDQPKKSHIFFILKISEKLKPKMANFVAKAPGMLLKAVQPRLATFAK